MLAISSTVYDVIISPKAIVEKQEELNRDKDKKSTDVQALIADGLAEMLGSVDAETIAEKCADKSSQYKKIATKIDSTTEDAVRKFISDNELAGCIYLTPNTKQVLSLFGPGSTDHRLYQRGWRCLRNRGAAG